MVTPPVPVVTYRFAADVPFCLRTPEVLLKMKRPLPPPWRRPSVSKLNWFIVTVMAVAEVRSVFSVRVAVRVGPVPMLILAPLPQVLSVLLAAMFAAAMLLEL